MTRDDYVAALKAIGHFKAAAVRKANGTGFYVECECGYKSTTRRTLELAVETIEHHRKKELAAARVSGVSLPGFAAGRR